jgi:hypothetical protein
MSSASDSPPVSSYQSPIDYSREAEARRAYARFVTKVERILIEEGGSSDLSDRSGMFQRLAKEARASSLDDLPIALQNALIERYASLRSLHVSFLQEVEYRAAQRTLSIGSNPGMLFRSPRQALISSEIKVSRMSSRSTVAFVGSGCFPWSAVLYHQRTKAKVVAFEREGELASIARRVINHLELSEGISIVNGELSDSGYEHFSHICFAEVEEPSVETLVSVAHGARPDAQILLRSARTPYQILYPSYSATLPIGAQLGTRAHTPSVAELETLIFRVPNIPSLG